MYLHDSVCVCVYHRGIQLHIVVTNQTLRQRSSPPWHVEDPVPRQTPQVGPPGVEADQWAHQAAESEQCSVSLSMHSFTSPSHWSACLPHHFMSTALYSPNSKQFASPCAHLLLPLTGRPVSHLTSLHLKSIPMVGNSIPLLITGKTGKYYA